MKNVNNMALAAKCKLSNFLYHDEKRRCTFESYVRQKVDQYSILKGLKYHGHFSIDPGLEVQLLLSGIKNSALDLVKNQILARFLFFFFWAGLCNPIACSLLGDGSQSQNSG